MTKIDQKLVDDLAAELALPLTPAEKLAEIASFHQRTVDRYDQEIVEIRKQSRASVTDLEKARKKLQAEHAADMDNIDRQISNIEVRAAAEIMAAEKLQLISRQAIEVLAS